MTSKPEENEDKLDWRFDLVATITADNRQMNVKKGDQVYKSSAFGKGASQLSFPMPSGTAIYLNISHQSFERAWSLRQNALTRPRRGEMRPEFLFEFFEQMSISIVFGFTALEAFANICIPEDYYFDQKHKSIYVSLGKENIERKVNLDTKLGKILPEVLKSDPIKDKKVWRDYSELKEVRDRLIHIKSDEAHSPHQKHDSIWDEMLKIRIGSPAKISYSVIDHYLKKKSENEKPWWYRTNTIKF